MCWTYKGKICNCPLLFGEDWGWLNEAGLPTYIGRWVKLYCSTLRAILLRMITYIAQIGEQYRSVGSSLWGDIVAFVVGGYRSLGGVCRRCTLPSLVVRGLRGSGASYSLCFARHLGVCVYAEVVLSLHSQLRRWQYSSLAQLVRASDC